MVNQVKTVQEINEKIDDGSVRVVTAAEMTQIVAELGPDEAAHEVDVVTTGTFGAMCSSGMWMNFGHSDPPIKMSRVWLNDVEAYGGVAAVDAYLGATQLSESQGMKYGGGHVIEDLIRRKSVHLRAEAYGTDCYPRTELSTEITVDEMNQAVLSNPRNCYERYVVAVNSTGKPLYTYMGKLLPNLENATYSGAGSIAPINNDPKYRTIGIGTRIFLGGSEGYITGSGTQHSPTSGFGTLALHGDLKEMTSDFIKGASFTKYGCTLYVGVGVPIPILNSEIAKSTGISDDQIVTNVIDYGVPSRDRPSLRKVTYSELKSGSIEVNGQDVQTSPLSSFKVAGRIANLLKERIASGTFTITAPVQTVSTTNVCNPMVQREPGLSIRKSGLATKVTNDQLMYRDVGLCNECGLCIGYCREGVFQRDEHWTITDDSELCVGCGVCNDICPRTAITVRG
ncbi:MAG: homocysteine biosynthesis protein [Candidatus Thorarchaeota archaeon]